MNSLKLTDEEKNLLREILECHLGDLRMGIADTRNCDFKAMLKEKK